MFGLRKMKYIELSVMKNDIDTVLEYIGTKAALQFSASGAGNTNSAGEEIKLKELSFMFNEAFSFLGIGFKNSSCANRVITDEEIKEAENICSLVLELKDRINKKEKELNRLNETISRTKMFCGMNIPLSDFKSLSFLTLRIGQLDPKNLPQLRENLGNRAVLIPLDYTDNSGGASAERIIAVSSKKGRFSLDSQLKKASFEPADAPEDTQDASALTKLPAQLLVELYEKRGVLNKELEEFSAEKNKIKNNSELRLKELFSSLNVKLTIEKIKTGFTETGSLYHLTGWTPADTAVKTVSDLAELTCGRIAANAYSPHEVPSVKNRKEKVPTAMKHNVFVKGFESVVFSYGAPLYGTIDPTPLVAFFFTIMFGIMFGDAGQGLVLLLLGILAGKNKKLSAKFKKFSIPLVSAGTASIVMGFLSGSFFTNEIIFIPITQKITGLFLAHPADRFLHILPMAESGGSIEKLLYFFGFTVAIGIIINSLGLLINIYNRFALKKYRAVFFSKTGIPGLIIFWYAIFFAVKLALGGEIVIIDFICFLVPLLCIVFGHLILRIIEGKKPLLENGLLAFVIEGFVEIMETVSSYFSSTVSFLRVGAFALAHAVFSFIIFYFTDLLLGMGAAGALSAALLLIAGNAIIIVLEGLIVAIQVVRLQYYEFFNKFFTETGAEFAPFRFSRQ